MGRAGRVLEAGLGFNRWSEGLSSQSPIVFRPAINYQNHKTLQIPLFYAISLSLYVCKFLYFVSVRKNEQLEESSSTNRW